MHHVLEARETKVMSMSEEMVALMEGNQTLQGELAAAREMSSSSMEEMRDEFTKRISTSQKKLQAVTKVWRCSIRNVSLHSESVTHHKVLLFGVAIGYTLIEGRVMNYACSVRAKDIRASASLQCWPSMFHDLPLLSLI